MAHVVEPGVHAQIGRTSGSPAARISARVRATSASVSQPMRCEVRRHHHARGHRFAMQPVAVAHAGFDRMAEGVAQIEHGADAAFALIRATTCALISHER